MTPPFPRRRSQPPTDEPAPAGSGPSPGAEGRAGSPARNTLADACSGLYSLVLSLRTVADLGDPTEFRQRVHKMLEKMDRDAKEAGHTTFEVDHARFALVAVLDAAILNSSWKGVASWRVVPLQLELFQTNVAGEEFFTRLETLRKNLDENRQVIQVYYDCLALGFEGRFKLMGRERLEALIQELRVELGGDGAWSMDKLSPHWVRPDEFTEAIGEGVPIWVTTLIFIPGVAILVFLFALAAKSSAKDTAGVLQGILNTLGG